MANELVELGSPRKKGRRAPRVCYKVQKLGKKVWGVATYSAKTGRIRDWLAAPCLRTKSRKKALRIPTRKAAEAYAKKCGFKCKKV